MIDQKEDHIILEVKGKATFEIQRSEKGLYVVGYPNDSKNVDEDEEPTIVYDTLDRD